MRNIDFGQTADNEKCEINYNFAKKNKRGKTHFVSILFVMVCGIGITALCFNFDVQKCLAGLFQSCAANIPKAVTGSKSGDKIAATTDCLNIRSGPDKMYGVICTVPDNTTLKLTGKTSADGAWVQVLTSGGKTGWCKRQLLAEGSSGFTNAASSFGEEGEAVTAEKMNIRSAPGTEHEIVCTVPGNTRLKLTGKTSMEDTWTQVQTLDGKTGWCCQPYLKLNAADVPPAQGPAKTANQLYIKVSLHNQMVTVLEANGRVVKTFTCSSGESGSETPFGTFTVSDRGISFYNSMLGEGAYYWTRFYGDYLFHSIPFNQNYEIKQQETVKLGKPASHGCIRLSIANAKWIYNNIPNGTKVTIH